MKLTNTFSKEFTIEIAAGRIGKQSSKQRVLNGELIPLFKIEFMFVFTHPIISLLLTANSVSALGGRVTTPHLGREALTFECLAPVLLK
ncbi:hypothetical protein F2Q68_00018342 [Brassica cretica]|uniref:Uncharacterized protein n=1 Tax=Brassica cretica TaxID=69181 RepID=A0A8S9HPB7_BRACR|nr:hypothetical protein F2Q68_00018342 [Brassica cretica]